MRYFTPIIALALLAGLSGCKEFTLSSTQKESAIVDVAQGQLVKNQPTPIYDWSLERHLLTKLYDARQRATTTFSYVQSDFTGKVLWSCPSIGFPIPYATQLTNPSKLDYRTIPASGGGYHVSDGVIPQAEPNGLYSPANSDATWVMCVNAKGKIVPRYEERKVSVSLIPLHEVNGSMVEVDGADASFSIDNPKK